LNKIKRLSAFTVQTALGRYVVQLRVSITGKWSYSINAGVESQVYETANQAIAQAICQIEEVEK